MYPLAVGSEFAHAVVVVAGIEADHASSSGWNDACISTKTMSAEHGRLNVQVGQSVSVRDGS